MTKSKKFSIDGWRRICNTFAADPPPPPLGMGALPTGGRPRGGLMEGCDGAMGRGAGGPVGVGVRGVGQAVGGLTGRAAGVPPVCLC